MLNNILCTLLILYVITLSLMYIFQRDFLYFPDPLYLSPQVAHAPKEIKELKVVTEDGLNLIGWYAPATHRPQTLVFFHGNGDSLSQTVFISAPYIAAGYGFLIAEYRGYSGMPGHPTEDGLYKDARAYLKALIASGVREEDIVLFGHSLGTGVAVQMATEFHVHSLILVAPFLSIPKVAQLHFPYLFAGSLVKDRYESFKKIPTLHIPVLIANGAQDEIIPPTHGKQLFELANEPKNYLLVPDAGHNNMFESNLVGISLKWLAPPP